MKIYVTDNTLPCFFTAVFIAYQDKEAFITSQQNVQISLESDVVYVMPDTEKSERVQKKLTEYDEYAIDEIGVTLRSRDTSKEQVCFTYIRLLMQKKRPIRKELGDHRILEMRELRDKVTNEIHRMKGFLRFMETETGTLYAPFSPDNDIVDFLVHHFAERLKNQPFVIHDVKRKKAAIYNGDQWIICEANGAEIVLSQYEKIFSDLWKKYYESVNISDRPHYKQMVNYMPIRYWKFLTEKETTN